MEPSSRDGTSQLTAAIISAYVVKHKIGSGELAKLIEDVHVALVKAPAAAAQPEQKELVPAVAIPKSVTPDYIISLEDGRKLKALKRHLTKLGMTPDEYRAKWRLPRDYPMVAATYAKQRSALAKSMGLGRKKAAPPAGKAASNDSSKKRPAKRTAKKAAAE